MANTDVVNSETGEIVAGKPQSFDDATLASMVSWDDAIKALESAGMVATDAAEYGTGFDVVDKATLVGIPFVAIEWRFNEGDYGQPYVAIKVMTKDGRKGVVIDGGTGIRDQMVKVTEDRLAQFNGDLTKAHAALICPKGLRDSKYTYTDAKGNEIPATTYYIAM